VIESTPELSAVLLPHVITILLLGVRKGRVAFALDRIALTVRRHQNLDLADLTSLLREQPFDRTTSSAWYPRLWRNTSASANTLF
jgi:hypothetical protein